jgi:hypothetical protein
MDGGNNGRRTAHWVVKDEEMVIACSNRGHARLVLVLIHVSFSQPNVFGSVVTHATWRVLLRGGIIGSLSCYIPSAANFLLAPGSKAITTTLWALKGTQKGVLLNNTKVGHMSSMLILH